MTLTDILIFIGLLLYVLLGFRDGFFKKLFAILGFWGGLVIATKLMTPFADRLIEWFDFTPEFSLVLAFLFTFLFISIGVNLFYRWFGKTGSDTLKIWSRLAGSTLGAVQGLVAISLFLIMLNIYDIPAEETQEESSLYKPTIQFAPMVFDFSMQWIPASKAFFEEVRGTLEKFTIPK